METKKDYKLLIISISIFLLIILIGIIVYFIYYNSLNTSNTSGEVVKNNMEVKESDDDSVKYYFVSDEAKNAALSVIQVSDVNFYTESNEYNVKINGQDCILKVEYGDTINIYLNDKIIISLINDCQAGGVDGAVYIIDEYLVLYYDISCISGGHEYSFTKMFDNNGNEIDSFDWPDSDIFLDSIKNYIVEYKGLAKNGNHFLYEVSVNDNFNIIWSQEYIDKVSNSLKGCNTDDRNVEFLLRCNEYGFYLDELAYSCDNIDYEDMYKYLFTSNE